MAAVLLVVGLAEVVVGLLTAPGLDARLFWVYAYSLVWLVTGYIAARVRPSARLGTLMMVYAIVDMIGTAGNVWHGDGTGFELLRTAAVLVTSCQAALIVHMGLTYPSGRSTDLTTTVTLWIVWAVMTTYAVAILLTFRRIEEIPYCATHRCTDVLFHAFDSERLRGDVRLAGGFAVAAVLVLAAVVLIRRWWTSSPRLRRLRGMPTTIMATASLLGAASAAANGLRGSSVASGPWFDELLIVTLLAVPAVFLVGLARERLDLARVSELVRQLGSALPFERLQPALAAALGDPRLELIADAGDRLLETPPDRMATPIGDPTRPTAVLIHDPSLRDEPQLLESVRVAVGLALDNARLQAELREQLTEVRASRARLVDAGDTARRRLERDLHDGAQQRLIAAGLALQAARTSRTEGSDGDPDGLLRAAEEELRAAIQELRELARGIHPAVLTELGLSAAVAQLAGRQPFPVQLRGDELPRLDQSIEATAYFVVSEALTNVGKHAHASTATVALELADGVLTIVVSDDGVGGATPAAGTGLAGLADRVAAADGTIEVDSASGRGTVVRAVLPCR